MSNTDNRINKAGIPQDLQSVLTEGDRPIKDLSSGTPYTFILGDETKFCYDEDLQDKTIPPDVFPIGAVLKLYAPADGLNVLQGVGVDILEGASVTGTKLLNAGELGIFTQILNNLWYFNKIGYTTTSTPNLEEVLTVGGTATDLGITLDNTSNGLTNDINSEYIIINDSVSGDTATITQQEIQASGTGESLSLAKNRVRRSKGLFYSDITFTDPTANRTVVIADESGTVAMRSYADAKVADAINDGVTTIAPSQNAVFDALALKADKSSASGTFTTADAKTVTVVDGIITSIV